MAEFRMPSLGADMTEGTLLDWLVGPGDEVHRGDIIAVVDTSKAEIEIEVFEDGTVGELLVAEGTKVPVGTPLAMILAPGAQPVVAAPEAAPVGHAVTPPGPEARAAAPEAPVVPAEPEAPVVPTAAPQPAPLVGAAARPDGPALVHGRPRVSPLARRAAVAKGVDPRAAHGTGWGGAVTLRDVLAETHDGEASAVADADADAVTATPVAQPASDRRSAMQQATGELMARAAREIPHFFVEQTIDLADALTWLEAHNAKLAVRDRVIPAALLLAASARAARAVPALNGSFADGAPHPADHVHLGVAVALRGGGLVAPAIHDADQLGVDALMASLSDVATRARGGKLRGSEMTDATITVTNLGDRGADKVDGVIYPPQLALIGFGRIRERPWAEHGLVGARPTVIATVAADHRATDGREASRLLAEIDRLLQNPKELL